MRRCHTNRCPWPYPRVVLQAVKADRESICGGNRHASRQGFFHPFVRQIVFSLLAWVLSLKIRTGSELILATQPYAKDSTVQSWWHVVSTAILLLAALGGTHWNFN